MSDRMLSLTRRSVVQVSATGLALQILGGERADAAPRARSAGSLDRDRSFDRGWKFYRGDGEGFEAAELDDSAWRGVDLPHDWSIEDSPGERSTKGDWAPPSALWEAGSRSGKTEKFMFVVEIAQRPKPDFEGPERIGPFDPGNSEGGWATAWTLGGVGWYRKTFSASWVEPSERLELRFDGAYKDTDVWLNGVHIAENTHGYLGFAVDLTPHLMRDRPNTIAVRVRNTGQNSRWYSGSGIYRHTWLTKTGQVRVPLWGFSIAFPDIQPGHAHGVAAVEVQNGGATTEEVAVAILVRDAKGRQVAAQSQSVVIAAGAQQQVAVPLTIKRPNLWSPDSPSLYQAEVTLAVKGKATDRLSTRFGVRSISLDPSRGLLINGQPYKLKGANLHHDNGLLGAAAIDRAERRKVELMKANGYNAIRCAHNPFSPEFLSHCDEIGMFVLDELFDTWSIAKVKDDYTVQFKDNWQRDLERMVRRDRNHPSVIFWGIGNEILEAASAAGERQALKMREVILSLDPSRPITAALTGGHGARGEPARRHLDVVGFNYAQGAYEADHALDTTKFYMGTEQFARDIHDSWREIERLPWLLGEFVWSGMDYLGEVGSGSSRLLPLGVDLPRKPIPYIMYLWDYPAYQSGCGELDILGLKKPQGLFRDVLWKRSQLEVLVQRPTPAGAYEKVGDWGWHDELESWTWPSSTGTRMTVRAYTNGDEVALLLNGVEAGRQRLSPTSKLTAEFEIPYAPGELVAVAYSGGRELARKALRTVGAPAALRLRPDRNRIDASVSDLAFVNAEVCDVHGQLVPDAAVPLEFACEGPAAIRAAGSANPRGVESFTDRRTRTFHGVAQAILQPKGARGRALLRVTSPGLNSAETEIILA